VKSASHPSAKRNWKKKSKKEKPLRGKLDKDGNLLKFSRDIDPTGRSRMTSLISDLKSMPPSIPPMGLSGHGNDPASHHDSPYLPLCVAGSCHTQNPIKKVYADKGYFCKNNREFSYEQDRRRHYDPRLSGVWN